MNIAIIGLPALHACGLKSMIGERWPEHVVGIFPIESQGWQDFDCHIVSAAALATLARFLMPKLDRVLLVTDSAPAAHTLMPMLSPLAPAKEIFHVLASMFACVAESEGTPVTHIPMTPREVEVLRLTAAGHTSRQIADRLCISQNTVLTHRKNIAAKTGLHTVSSITHYAMVHGLLH